MRHDLSRAVVFVVVWLEWRRHQRPDHGCGWLSAGEKMEDDEITELINTVDIDGDGEVDLKEFMAVVLDRAFVP